MEKQSASNKRVVLIDYGAGNVFNVAKACRACGVEAELTSNPHLIETADGLILPGVDAFRSLMDAITRRNLVKPIKQAVENGTPLLGICTGMQVLFESATSTDGVNTKGLGFLQGNVIPLPITTSFRVPEIGWNKNHLCQPDSVFANADNQYTYFVHSDYVQCAPNLIVADAQYGVRIPSIVQNGVVVGMQFHPEKSGQAGLDLLGDFLNQMVIPARPSGQ